MELEQALDPAAVWFAGEWCLHVYDRQPLRRVNPMCTGGDQCFVAVCVALRMLRNVDTRCSSRSIERFFA